MFYDDSQSEARRISLSSILLLIIFVSAAALIVTAIIWRPWFGDDAPGAPVVQPQVEEQVPAGDPAAEAVPDANVP